jgi:hypothetical protein
VTFLNVPRNRLATPVTPERRGADRLARMAMALT